MTTPADPSLAELGLINTGAVHLNNLSPARLVEKALRRHEGILTERGALVAYTGTHTGRSPKDRFLVDAAQKNEIWWGSVNREKMLDRRKVSMYARNAIEYFAEGCST